MRHFEHKDTGSSFDLPEAPTVRWAMRVKEALFRYNEASFYEQGWAAICAVAENWKSDVVPDLKFDVLDEVDNPRAADVVEFACLNFWTYYTDFMQVPKN